MAIKDFLLEKLYEILHVSKQTLQQYTDGGLIAFIKHE